MNYLDDLADEIRRRLPARLIPDEDTWPLFRLYAVLTLAKGQDVTLADVHNAWAAWMSARNPQHASLKPFDELSAEVQRADEPFLDAIRSVARDQRGDLGHGSAPA